MGESIALGGYPAKQCPRRTHNRFAPDAPAPAPPSPELQALFDAGIAFEADIVALLRAQFAGASTDLVVFDPAMDWQQCQVATVEALDAGTAVVVGGRLPEINGRVGAPDVLVKYGAGYVPVDVKHHQTMKAAGRTTSVTVSPLTERGPAARSGHAGFSSSANHWRDDAMQLAHYTRMLQDLGYHPSPAGTDEQPALLIGGIIGTSDLTELLGSRYGIVWYELARPNQLTYSASTPDHRKRRSALQRYDHEFAFRLKVAQVAQSGGELVRPFRTAECAGCEWFDYCAQVAGPDDASFALQAGHLSARQWRYLYDAAGSNGSLTVQQLAGVDPAVHAEEFAKHSVGVNTPQRTLENAVRRAQMTVARQDLQPHSGAWPTPPSADIEIDFDIEWDADDFIYQWGLRIRDGHDDSTARYEPVVSFAPMDTDLEAKLADEFADRIAALRAQADQAGKTLAVFHWSHPEISRTRRFPKVAAALDGVCLDLLDWFNTQFFARKSCSIKDVAPLFGFQWGVDDAGGRASQLKIGEARQRGVAADAARRWCLTYNESDVHAQAAIRDGLRRYAVSAPAA